MPSSRASSASARGSPRTAASSRRTSSSGSSKNRNVLAALLEAVLGALFLEHGFPAIEEAVVDAFAARIEYALTTHVDHKTELQEALARSGKQVSYVVLTAEGPPHERHFTCAAMVDGEQLGVGEGSSKKAAEQEAAREALAQLAAGVGRLSLQASLAGDGREAPSELRAPPPAARGGARPTRDEPKGILELFPRDEDAPIARDDARPSSGIRTPDSLAIGAPSRRQDRVASSPSRIPSRCASSRASA